MPSQRPTSLHTSSYLGLTHLAGDAHILQFELVETSAQRWRGYRTWVCPGRVPRVEEVVVEDPILLEMLQAVLRGVRTSALFLPLIDVAELWQALPMYCCRPVSVTTSETATWTIRCAC